MWHAEFIHLKVRKLFLDLQVHKPNTNKTALMGSALKYNTFIVKEKLVLKNLTFSHDL